MTEDSFLKGISRFFSIAIVVLVATLVLLIVFIIYIFMDNFRAKRENVIESPVIVTPRLMLIRNEKAIDTVYVYQFK